MQYCVSNPGLAIAECALNPVQMSLFPDKIVGMDTAIAS